jgi:hypothetical protein
MSNIRKVMLAAVATLLLPSSVLAQSACQTTLQQARAAEAKLSLDYQNGQLQLGTVKNNGTLDCEKAAIGKTNGSAEEAQCVTQVNNAYQSSMIDLQKAYNLAYSNDEQLVQDVSGGSGCPWSPEEITQFATQMTQAAAQFTQSVAQVITAAKSKPGTAAPTSPKPSTPTPPSSTNQPSNHNPQSPQSPKSPTSPPSPGTQPATPGP